MILESASTVLQRRPLLLLALNIGLKDGDWRRYDTKGEFSCLPCKATW
jgi:hypothetical protein